jgi:hypothetical protein
MAPNKKTYCSIIDSGLHEYPTTLAQYESLILLYSISTVEYHLVSHRALITVSSESNACITFSWQRGRPQ